MSSKGEQTQQRIAEQGLAMLCDGGMASISLNTLAERIGMSKSGLFAHFASKEALQIAILKRAEALAAAIILPAMDAAPPGLARLHALFEAWFGWSDTAGLAGGCPMEIAAFDPQLSRGALRDHVLHTQSRWLPAFENIVREAIDAGELSPQTDPRQFVWEFTALYHAYHFSAYVLGEPDAKDRARAGLHRLIESYKNPHAKRKQARRPLR